MQLGMAGRGRMGPNPALWTEMCIAFVALDALREGYEVYPVTDAIGGTSPEAHRAGLDRGARARRLPRRPALPSCRSP